jgi:hypothetical protein
VSLGICLLVDSEHQVIIAAEAFGSVQKHELFAPVLEQAEETISRLTGEKRPLSDTVILADTGYFAESNVELCARKHLDAYCSQSIAISCRSGRKLI